MPPTPTARQTPAGIKLDEGFPTKITFSRDPNIEFWEKTVKPPGLDGGDPVDTTTMHNSTYRTMNPRKLKTMTAMSTKVAYDPVVYSSILELINVKDTVTVTFSDGSTLAFYGYLKEFSPDDIDEGKQPEAGITIIPTNQHPTTGAESGAVLTSVTGT
jgi:hypothetical protein